VSEEDKGKHLDPKREGITEGWRKLYLYTA
jgi:hypothetical protein